MYNVHARLDNPSYYSGITTTEPTYKTLYRVVAHPAYGCNSIYQYGYKLIVSAGFNLLFPILIMIVLNGMAVVTLIKGKETLKVSSYREKFEASDYFVLIYD